MSSTQITRVEPGLRIPIPVEWAEDLGTQNVVSLERTTEGILVRPCCTEMASMSWEQFFADKLTIGSGQRDNSLHLTTDDYLF